MTDPSRPRPHTGRHRGPRPGSRRPLRLSSSSVLPGVAAAAMVLTATGAATGARESSAPLTLEITRERADAARAELRDSTANSNDLAARRQAAALQSSAIQGRAEARQRAARSAARKAAAQAAAKAKAERKAAAQAAATAKAAREGKRWVTAIRSGRLTSDFGPRWGKTHDGLDIGASTGTPIYAMSKGVVVRSAFDSSFGNKVEIQYWNGATSWYAHMSRRLVREGESVQPGDIVGRVGNTGNSTGPHLHIEIQPTGGVDQPINPAPSLAEKNVTIG